MVSEKKICSFCGNVRTLSSFAKSPSMFSTERVPMCSACREERFNTYAGILKNDKAALWCLLMELGIPFIDQVWEKGYKNATRVKAGGTVRLFNCYIKALFDSGIPVKGIWDSDTMLDDIWCDSEKKLKEHKEEKKVKNDIDTMVQVWGKFTDGSGKLDKDAYVFLEKAYKNYTSEFEEMDVNTENRYRDLCRCEFQLRKANESGISADISKAQDRLNKQLALLGLNDFKGAVKSEEQQAFEKRVSMIEFSKPAECEDLQKYIDMVGYDKEKAILMRSLKNAIAGTREYPDITKGET